MKKLLLSLTAIGALVAPVVAITSCHKSSVSKSEVKKVFKLSMETEVVKALLHKIVLKDDSLPMSIDNTTWMTYTMNSRTKDTVSATLLNDVVIDKSLVTGATKDLILKKGLVTLVIDSSSKDMFVINGHTLNAGAIKNGNTNISTKIVTENLFALEKLKEFGNFDGSASISIAPANTVYYEQDQIIERTIGAVSWGLYKDPGSKTLLVFQTDSIDDIGFTSIIGRRVIIHLDFDALPFNGFGSSWAKPIATVGMKVVDGSGTYIVRDYTKFTHASGVLVNGLLKDSGVKLIQSDYPSTSTGNLITNTGKGKQMLDYLNDLFKPFNLRITHITYGGTEHNKEITGADLEVITR